MPKRKMENITCDNKKGYPSEREANKAKNCVKKHSKRSKLPKRAYYCRQHRCWHLTSLKKKNDFNE